MRRVADHVDVMNKARCTSRDRLRRGATAARTLLTVAILTVGAASANAQYDRYGRYVPSPMGVPADPHARPIPLYSGTPGGAIGTPREPPLPPYRPLPGPIPPITSSPTGSRPITIMMCNDGWSRATRVSKAEFDRRCGKMLSR
jgi:hypothetical protein